MKERIGLGKVKALLKSKDIKKTVKHDHSVMAWGCFNWKGIGNLHLIDGIMNANVYIRILSEHMIPSSRRLFRGNFILQHDNDPKHTAKKVKDYLSSKNIEILDWPSQSADLNPIENLWFELKKLIKAENIKKKSDLAQGIKISWEKISSDYCKSLVESMPRRMDELVKNKGLWINY